MKAYTLNNNLKAKMKEIYQYKKGNEMKKKNLGKKK